LLAPHRVGRTEAKPHDGTIITGKVNEIWGTDMTQTITIREGTANVFVAVEHSNSELIGIHASRSANRFEALELVRSGGASVCTVCGHRGADVLPLFEPVRMGTDA
jgi:putative transposase